MTEILGLRSHDWKRRYNQPPDSIIGDFYRPALRRSVRYDRAVGFYSSRLLAMVSPDMDDFVQRGGTMRLVTSPSRLSDEDLAAIGKGEQFQARMASALHEAIKEPIPSRILANRLSLLTWMVSRGVLQVKIALRDHGSHYSLFHEKIGVFTDSDGNWMTFTGSPNETRGGTELNAESFPLHRSWESPDQREFAEDERERFNEVFDEEVPGIAVWHNANEWIIDPLRDHFGEREPERTQKIPKPGIRAPIAPIEDAEPPVTLPGPGANLQPSLPSWLTIRDYQRKAVNDWLHRSGRGIFAMATGTGKTITALIAANQVAQFAANQNRPLLVLVVVPLKDLVHQWAEAAEAFGFRPAVCHSGITAAEERQLKSAFSAARTPTGRRTEMVITTAGSLTPTEQQTHETHYFQRQLRKHRGLLLVIGDEMHSLGTPARLAALPASPSFALGLSATPKRHGDDEGTTDLIEYFGDVVVSINIRQAIYEYEALVPYHYHPQFIDLTDEEAERYRKLSAAIAAAYGRGDEDTAEKIVRKRVRLTQHAENKLVELDRLVQREGLDRATHQIVYAAEGKGDPADDLRSMDAIVELLRNAHGMRVARYYGETSTDERKSLQQGLADGNVQALVAMKCLDEGVDIPSARIGVITASTQNPRQFVQRRGRILRRDPDRPKPDATIFDMIVRPPMFPGGASDSEKRLVGTELSRAAELAEAAENREVIFDIVEEAIRFGLTYEDHPWLAFTDQDHEEVLETWTTK